MSLEIENEELLTVKDGSNILNCGVTKMYEYMTTGVIVASDDGLKTIKLESIKIGKLRRIPRSSINKFIATLLASSRDPSTA